MSGRYHQRSFPEIIKEVEFVSKQAFYPQSNSIDHWQLRDLIACTDKYDEVYCVDDTQLLCYNTNTSQADVVKNLGYEPSSMTAGHGYLCAGGQKGQLDVFTIYGHCSIFSSKVGEKVNNALHVGTNRFGEKRLLVSNNDNTVKVFSLPTMDQLDVVKFPTAVNYSALSPDGQFMVCVGDDKLVYVYNTTNGFQEVAQYGGAYDSCICCAWNASGSAFAAASQDGSVSVWETRMGKQLAQFNTDKRHADHSGPPACRAVKFSSGAIDLMAFSEHVDRFHVVDARTFNTHQVVQVEPSALSMDYGPGCGISGLAFVEDGTHLFVGLEKEGIADYKVDTHMRCSFDTGSLR